MTKNRNEIVVLIDRSAGVRGHEAQITESYNNFVKSVRSLGNNTLFSLILFDSDSRIICSRIPAGKAKFIKEQQITACGSSGLSDAMRRAMLYIGTEQSCDWENERPVSTQFIVITGNSSNERVSRSEEQFARDAGKLSRKSHWFVSIINAA